LLVASFFQIGAGLAPVGWLVAITLGCAVAAWMIANTLGTTIFQRLTPLHMQGRVFALRRSLEQATWPLSLLFTGLLVPSVIQADQFLVIAGSASLVIVIVVLWLLRLSQKAVPANVENEFGD
jgi:hypothetical protein